MTELLGPKIKMLNTLVEKELNNSIHDLLPNFTGSQFAVLAILYQSHRDYVTQKDIETELRLSHPTTRGMIKRLTTWGFINNEPLITDRRQISVSLTTLGKKFMDDNFDEIAKRVEQVESHMSKDISESELTQFVQTLNKLINNL